MSDFNKLLGSTRELGKVEARYRAQQEKKNAVPAIKKTVREDTKIKMVSYATLKNNTRLTDFEPTMDDMYHDESNHLACKACGMCIDCGDCKKHGCK